MLRINLSAKAAIAVALLSMFAGAPIAAGDGLIPLEHFGQLPQFSAPKISPDGTRMATLMPVRGKLALVIQSIRPGQDEAPALVPLDNAEINWVRWVNNDRLIASAGMPTVWYGTEITVSRLFGVDRTGKNFKVFKLFKRDSAWFPQFQDRVIDMLADDDRRVLITVDKDGYDRYAVYSMEVTKGKLKKIQGARKFMKHWLTDQEGQVRLGFGYDYKRMRLHIKVRRSVDDKFEELPWQQAYKDQVFKPVALHCADPSRFYVWSAHETGKTGLYVYDMDEKAIVDRVFLHDQFDLIHAKFDKATACLVGVSYIENSLKTVYFEEPYKSRYASLKATFPGRNVTVSSSSADNRYWIVTVSGSMQPAHFYYFDSEARQISLLATAYPELDENDMMASYPISYLSRDGVEISGYVTYPPGEKRQNLPAVIMPHGGPASREMLAFDFWTQFLANRGYLVFQPNFRGSSGFGDEYEADALATWGGTATNDIEDGAKWLVGEGWVDADRICAVGGSYGGYAALMSIIQSPDFYQCAVSLNGVSDPVALLAYSKNYRGKKFSEEEILGDRKTRDLKAFSPYHRAEEIPVPVLLLHAEKDRNVRYKQSTAMARRLKRLKKDYRFIKLPDDSHYLEREENRMTFLREMEIFLAAHIGPGRPAASD